jgi:hypothetical protein
MSLIVRFAYAARFTSLFATICFMHAATSTIGLPAPILAYQSCDILHHHDVEFSGKVVAGQSYQRRLSTNYGFGLRPGWYGWMVQVYYGGKDVLIPIPMYPYPSAAPYDIEGWDFRNLDNTGPNAPGPKSVNSEGSTRILVFSPQCWSAGKPLCDSEGDLATFKGSTSCMAVIIDSLELGDLKPNHKAYIKRMTFTVRLAYAPGFPP